MVSGFRLGFGVVSVLFGPSARGPVEVLADLGGAIDFNTKMRAGCLKTMFSILSLWHGQILWSPFFEWAF